MEQRRILKPRKTVSDEASVDVPSTLPVAEPAQPPPVSNVVPLVIDLPPWDPNRPLPELTADIIREIMRYLGQHPLMHKARPVCKAWCKYADEILQRHCSVFISPWAKPEVWPPFAERYSGIKSLSILSPIITDYAFLLKFTGLLSLELRHAAVGAHYNELLPSLRELTRLSIIDCRAEAGFTFSTLAALTTLRYLDLSRSDEVLETVKNQVLWTVLQPLRQLNYFGWRAHIGISTTFVGALQSLTQLDLTHSNTEHAQKLFRLLPHSVTSLAAPASVLLHDHFKRVTTLRSLCVVLPQLELRGEAGQSHRYSNLFAPTTLTSLHFLCSNWQRGVYYPLLQVSTNTVATIVAGALASLRTRNGNLLRKLTLSLTGTIHNVGVMDLDYVRTILPPKATLELCATLLPPNSLPRFWLPVFRHLSHATIVMAFPPSNTILWRLCASFLNSIPENCGLRSILFVMPFFDSPALSPPQVTKPITFDFPGCPDPLPMFNAAIARMRARGFLIRIRALSYDEVSHYDRPLDGIEWMGFTEVNVPLSPTLWRYSIMDAYFQNLVVPFGDDPEPWDIEAMAEPDSDSDSDSDASEEDDLDAS